MSINPLIYPMFAFYVWTQLVMLVNLVMRIQAVRTKQVSAKYFQTFNPQKGTPSERMIQGKNHMENLFQMPVLFFVGCLTALLLEKNSHMVISLAWAYVGLRMVHTYIHMTYNFVFHRMLAFMSSNVVLMILWITIIFCN